MKANKLLKTLAASAMSLALMASVTAMPAMAADGVFVGGDNTFANNQFTVPSYLRVGENVASPNLTLKFTIEVATAVQNETVGDGANTALVYTGEADGLYFGESAGKLTTTTVTYTAQAPVDPTDSNTYYTVYTPTTHDVVFKVDPNEFSHAGVYKYTVKVDDVPAVTGVTPSGDKTVYVYVRNPEGSEQGMQITGVVMKDATGTTKSGSFVSTYLTTTTDYATLLLSKEVAGLMGNQSAAFTFNVKITAANSAANTKYYYETGSMVEGQFVADGTQNLTNQILNAGGENNPISLGHNHAIKIYGLQNGDSCTIDETDYTGDGYTTTIVASDSENTDNTAHTVASLGDITVAYTNTRNTVTPTGIILNIAPYALMVVIAVAGVAVFMRKRVEE